MASGFKSDRRLCLTGDKSRVVEVSDESAGWLFASEGSVISVASALAYGLECREGKVILPKPPAEPKAAKKGEDKALKRGGDKAASARPPDGEKP